MSWDKIREYFQTRIRTVSPDRVEWQDAFNVENIPITIMNKAWHVDVTAIPSSPNRDKHIEDRAVVVLFLARKLGQTHPQDQKDLLLKEAHQIRCDLINPLNAEAFGPPIDLVENLTNTIEEKQASNDNIAKIELQFNVRMFYGNP